MQTFFQIVLMQKFILALIILFLFFMWINHQGLCDAVPLVSSRWIVHLQSVQLLYTAPADGYGGVGEADGSSLCPAGAAGRRHPLLAGDGSAAAGVIAHRLSHTHLTERQLVCELMVLLEIQEEMLHLRCFEQEMCHNVCPELYLLLSFPDNAAGDGVGSQREICSSDTERCHCLDPER